MINQLLGIIPPDLIPVDLQPLFYFTLLPLALILGIIVVVVGYLLILPPEGRLYMANKLKKLPMVDYETDEGVRCIEMIKPYTEGVNYGVSTGNTYLTPRPIANETILEVITPDLIKLENKLKTEGEKDANIAKILESVFREEINKVREMERIILKPSTVRGLGVPIYRAYQSKALATTLAHLVGLEYTSDDNQQTQFAVPVVAKTGKAIQPVNLLIEKGKTKKVLDEWVVNVLLPVDPNVVKKWFPYMWTQSQIKASNKISEEVGRNREHGIWKRYIMIMAIMVIMMCIFFVAVIVSTGGV